MNPSADHRLEEQARLLGFALSEPIKIGGQYTPVLRDGDSLYVSGQIPRVGDVITAVGRVGDEVSFEQACVAARICTLRALALVRQLCGTLETVRSVPRMTVFIRSAATFTQHSEVADAASALLVAVLGEHAAHSRTSVGVAQLPKGAAIEIDFIVKAPLAP